jgi:hypothetical protein
MAGCSMLGGLFTVSWKYVENHNLNHGRDLFSCCIIKKIKSRISVTKLHFKNKGPSIEEMKYNPHIWHAIKIAILNNR